MNLSFLDAGILIMVQQVRLMMFTLNMVDYPMSFLSMSTFFWWTSREDHSRMFLLFEFCCETPPSCLKVRGWVEPESMWWSQSLCGGLQHFSVSPRPLGFGFGTKGFGARAWQYLILSHISIKDMELFDELLVELDSKARQSQFNACVLKLHKCCFVFCCAKSFREREKVSVKNWQCNVFLLR